MPSSDENEEEASQFVNNFNSGVATSRNNNENENAFYIFDFRHVKLLGEIIFIHFIFGVGIWFYDFYGNISLISNLYYSMMEEIGNHSKTMTENAGGNVENIIQQQHPPLDNDERDILYLFCWSFIFFAAPLVIILWKVIITFLKEGNLRPFDLIYLKWKHLSSVVSQQNNYDHNVKRRIDATIELREKELASIDYFENIFMSGPQLLLKMHLLFLHLIKDKDLWSYGRENLVFIAVGILACTWKVARYEISIKENGKKTSWIEHILHFLGHFLYVGVRFILLGMLSANSLAAFTILFVVHFLYCYTTIVNIVKEGGGSCWTCNKIFGVFRIFFSSLWFHLDVDKKNKKMRGIFKLVEYVLNFVTWPSSLTTAMPLCGLYAGMALIVSRVLLGKEQKDDIRVDELRDIVSVSTRTSHRITRVTEVNRTIYNNNLQKAKKENDLRWLCANYKKQDLFRIATQCINNGANVNNGVDDTGDTALISLCRNYKQQNLIDTARLLINKGADVNSIGERQMTALQWICSSYENDNLCAIVELFINKGANLNNDIVNTALIRLCQQYKHPNLIDTARLLITKGVDVNFKGTGNQMTALHWLCSNYNYDNLCAIVELFIEKGADVTAVNEDGETALHRLCDSYEHGNLCNIIALLLEKDNTVNVLDCREETALHRLLSSKYVNRIDLLKVVKLFIEKRADLQRVGMPNTSTNPFEKTPIQIWLENYKEDDLLDILKLMVQHGAGRLTGYSSLHWLCRFYKRRDLIDFICSWIKKATPPYRLFLNHFIPRFFQSWFRSNKAVYDEVNAKDADGRTPILELCRYYDKDNLVEIVQLLIDNGADVKVADNNKRTPLLEICENYQKNDLKCVVQYMINKGSVVNAKGLNGSTPLLELCNRHNVVEVIQLLMASKNGIPKDDPIGSKVGKLLEGNYDTTTLENRLGEVYNAEQKKRN